MPWAPLEVPAPTADSASTLPNCAATDIVVSPLAFAGYAAGMEGFSGTFSLAANQACSVPGDPTVTFASGSAASVNMAKIAGGAPTVVGLMAKASGTVDLQIENACAVPQLTSASVALASGDSVTLKIGALPVTGGAACPGTATYSLQFNPSQPSQPAVPDPALRVTVSTSGAAAIGMPFSYVVTLTNVGHSAVSLSPCPAYDEGVKTFTGFGESYQLNCQATAGQIPPGQSLSFEMRLQIPTGAPAGQYELDWDLEGTAIAGSTTIVLQ